MTNLRRLAVPALAVAVGLVLAGCGTRDATLAAGSSATTTPPASADVETNVTSDAYNDADIAFATGMLPHHEQAITMSDQALTKSTNADVKRLATSIKAAQQPEIDQLKVWAEAWFQVAVSGVMPGMSNTTSPDSSAGPTTSPSASAAPSVSHEGEHPGMLTAAELAQLDAATGPAFDKLWLTLMIRHHEGAVTMAETELANGENPDAKAMAQRVVDSQNKEIADMQKVLGGLG